MKTCAVFLFAPPWVKGSQGISCTSIKSFLSFPQVLFPPSFHREPGVRLLSRLRCCVIFLLSPLRIFSHAISMLKVRLFTVACRVVCSQLLPKVTPPPVFCPISDPVSYPLIMGLPGTMAQDQFFSVSSSALQ